MLFRQREACARVSVWYLLLHHEHSPSEPLKSLNLCPATERRSTMRSTPKPGWWVGGEEDPHRLGKYGSSLPPGSRIRTGFSRDKNEKHIKALCSSWWRRCPRGVRIFESPQAGFSSKSPPELLELVDSESSNLVRGSCLCGASLGAAGSNCNRLLVVQNLLLPCPPNMLLFWAWNGQSPSMGTA